MTPDIRKALEPFAKLGEQFENSPDHLTVCSFCGVKITIADLRRAREAWEGMGSHTAPSDCVDAHNDVTPHTRPLAYDDTVREALESINRIASPNPERTFDIAVSNLDCITDLARLAIRALKTTPAPTTEKPLAWRYELALSMHKNKYCDWTWRLSEERPDVPEGAVRNLTPLYASYAPALSQEREALETIAYCTTGAGIREVEHIWEIARAALANSQPNEGEK